MKNYKLSDETKTLPYGTVLHRIVATTTFTLACGLTVTEGDTGGWIEKESNLSDSAWVSDNAEVYGNAQVRDNAQVSDNAEVYGNAQVRDNAQVSDNAQVYGDAQVCGSVLVFGNARVYGNAQVYSDAEVSGHAQASGNARVSGDARVLGNAWIYENARVCGNTLVYGNAQVSGYAEVFGDVQVCGDARVVNTSDYLVFKNNWSSGRYFTWTKSNDMWAEDCFYGTGDELIKNAYADSEDNGKHYEAFVKLVETLKNMEQGK